ncbi:MAG: hypothetical protein H6828_00935 [Planctomycetes bacterium]|nr:hypothetical protein [Planctomycetota bacterium]
MSLALLLCLALAGEPVGTARVEPAQVHMGEPFEVTIEVEHDADRAPVFDAPDPGDDWWLEREARRATLPLADAPGRARTTLTYRLAGIRPGEHELALPPARVEGEGGPQLVELPVTKVSIAGELAEGEDAPRPLKGFRAAPPEPPAPRWRALLGLALGALLLGGAGVFAWAWRRGPRRVPRAPSRPRRSSGSTRSTRPIRPPRASRTRSRRRSCAPRSTRSSATTSPAARTRSGSRATTRPARSTRRCATAPPRCCATPRA